MPQNCPHCGQPLKDAEDRGRKSPEPMRDTRQSAEQTREYDHRGIALPRRMRVGGIIMPQ